MADTSRIPQAPPLMGRVTVHVIDDDDAVRDSLALLLEAEGLAVATYASARVFLDGGERRRGCVLADVEMDGVDGLELLGLMKAAGLALPVVLMTGRPGRELTNLALHAGAARVLDKPFTSESLIEALQSALSAAG